MTKATWICGVATAVLGWLSLPQLAAQVPTSNAARPGMADAGMANPALTAQVRTVLNFYGSTRAAETLSQIPRPIVPAAPTAGMPQTRRVVRPPRMTGGQPRGQFSRKPFASSHLPPSVSPYLNLFRPDEDDAAPNYFAFVRPQMQQLEVNRHQQFELQHLHRQMQQTQSMQGAPLLDSRGMPTTGHGTRFLDLGGFYQR